MEGEEPESQKEAEDEKEAESSDDNEASPAPSSTRSPAPQTIPAASSSKQEHKEHKEKSKVSFIIEGKCFSFIFCALICLGV